MSFLIVLCLINVISSGTLQSLSFSLTGFITNHNKPSDAKQHCHSFIYVFHSKFWNEQSFTVVFGDPGYDAVEYVHQVAIHILENTGAHVKKRLGCQKEIA